MLTTFSENWQKFLTSDPFYLPWCFNTPGPQSLSKLSSELVPGTHERKSAVREQFFSSSRSCAPPPARVPVTRDAGRSLWRLAPQRTGSHVAATFAETELRLTAPTGSKQTNAPPPHSYLLPHSPVCAGQYWMKELPNRKVS